MKIKPVSTANTEYFTLSNTKLQRHANDPNVSTKSISILIKYLLVAVEFLQVVFMLNDLYRVIGIHSEF